LENFEICIPVQGVVCHLRILMIFSFLMWLWILTLLQIVHHQLTGFGFLHHHHQLTH